MFFETVLAVVVAAAIALIWSLAAGLSGPVTSMIVVAAVILVGGVTFSILEVRRSANRNQVQNTQFDEFDAALHRLEREKLAQQPKDVIESYLHHQQHPESPGEDQGQLTSHLAGTTPFFEKFDKPEGKQKS